MPLCAPALNNERAKKGLLLEPKSSRWSLLRTNTRPLQPTPFKYAAQSVSVIGDPSSTCSFLASSARTRDHRQGRISILVLVPPRLHSPVNERSTVLRSLSFNRLPDPNRILHAATATKSSPFLTRLFLGVTHASTAQEF